jgi:hypothetical protein
MASIHIFEIALIFPSSSLAFNHLDIKRCLPSVLVSVVNKFFLN